ncbi:1-deoxy-D-xylulose-5-phosphate synthase [Eubacteriales bacterium KG127]
MKESIYDYSFPSDLKKMNPEEMGILSYQIREFLIEKVSKTGGHIAPNLGVVELTLALHKVFDSPKDKLIWDVGHQSYVHKILTGRARGFDSLRTFEGMSGFPKVSESPHDIFDTGHSSTSISLAMGMAASRDMKKEDYHVVSIIGDGAMTGGIAFEGLNNISERNSRVIVILNDNGMSISPNVGGMAKHLSNLRTSDPYLNVKKVISKVENLPKVGDILYKSMRNAKEHMKYALLPKGVLFEELGLTYLGPIDGHNIEEIITALESAKKINGPVLVHAITKKGKGYISAEKNPDKYHGIGPFNPCTGLTSSSSGSSYSNVAGDEILKMAKEHSDIVTLSAAMCDATGLGKFMIEFPERFFDVGIAEAHGVTFSAGMAANGLRPVVAIYSSFLQRAYDQIIEDVCIQNLPIIFAIDRAGVVGADGETHHGVFDIGYLSTMPNMTILTPYGEAQLRQAFRYAYELNSPVAIRYPRGLCPQQIESNTLSDIEFKNERIFEGKDVDIWAVGRMMDKATKVRDILTKKGLEVGIVDVKQVKPLDISALNIHAKLIISIEDGVETGGFGQQMASRLLIDGIHIQFLNFSWPDKFVEHGDVANLEKKYGLDTETMAEKIYEKRTIR